MGQRLNIEIWDNGKVLANAYFQWGAFTEGAMFKTKAILDAIPCVRVSDPALRSFELLKTVTKHDGRIATDEEGVNEIRDLEENRVEIHLDTRTVSFDVFYRESEDSYKMSRYYIESSKLPTLDFDCKHIDFDDFARFDEEIKNLPSTTFTLSKNPGEVFWKIAEMFA